MTISKRSCAAYLCPKMNVRSKCPIKFVTRSSASMCLCKDACHDPSNSASMCLGTWHRHSLCPVARPSLIDPPRTKKAPANNDRGQFAKGFGPGKGHQGRRLTIITSRDDVVCSVPDFPEVTFCCTLLHLPMLSVRNKASAIIRANEKRPHPFRDDTLLVTRTTGASSQSGGIPLGSIRSAMGIGEPNPQSYPRR